LCVILTDWPAFAIYNICSVGYSNNLLIPN